MNIPSGDAISSVSSHVGVTYQKMMNVFPSAVTHPPTNFIVLNNNFESTAGFVEKWK